MLKAKKSVSKFWINFVVLIVLLLSVISIVWVIPFLSTTPPQKSFMVSEGLEKIFTNKFLKDFDVNSGITIVLLSFYDKPTDTQAGVFFDVAVLNHANEVVSFPNAAYGLQLFSPNEISYEWREIKTAFPLGNDETLLAQHTETYSLKTNNSFFMPYVAFDHDVPEKIRICVFGVGQLSHQKYAACVDAIRKK